MSDLTPDPVMRRMPGGPSLSPRQKAAVVVHLLISGGFDPGLRDLPRAQQRRLVSDMAALRFIDRQTLAEIIAEFASELDSIGLHVPRDPAKIVAALENSLSLDVVESLMADLGGDALPSGGTWDTVADAEDETLLALMADESEEVCAILLSKLPVRRSAELLGKLEPERADGIAAAFARTEGVTPVAVARIGMALGRQSASQPDMAFDTDPVARVGEILNAARSSVRRNVLDSLDSSNAAFAARVRAAVFSFENIPDRLDPRDVPKALRGVDNAKVVSGLGGAPEEVAKVVEFILTSISARLADQIRDEISERGTIPPEEGEEGMAAIVTSIRDLEELGEITLLVPEE